MPDPDTDTPLGGLIRREIELTGPMPVSRYMALCLQHPDHGYYTNRDPLGAAGDFTTAPEISQLFGEMIGAWLVTVWRLLGCPAPLRLVELGPGRGTLMADALRTASRDAEFIRNISLHLIENNQHLRMIQNQSLKPFGLKVTHHDTLDDIPDGPVLVVANEFLDALPIDQWVRGKTGWHRRKIGLDASGNLAFGVDPTPFPAAPKAIGDAPPGTILEHSPAQDAVVDLICKRLNHDPGAALFLDYGSLNTGTGDTLQAVRGHRPEDPFANPGVADLTTQIDFNHLARRVGQTGLRPFANEQGPFLLALGLLERAGRLGAGKETAEQEAISLAVERLAGDAAMGRLFKVLGFASAPLALPGLSPHPT